MSLGFALLVAGGVLLLSGVRNRSIGDVLSGITDPTVAFDGFRDAIGVGQVQVSRVAGLADAGVGTFDGQPVCNWIIPILIEARRRGWKGTVNDGVRTDTEQAAACTNLCGNPGGCPGTCAAPGKSNHRGCAGRLGAVDVSDYVTFGQIMAQLNYPLRNNLPNDPVHFSKTGQ